MHIFIVFVCFYVYMNIFGGKMVGKTIQKLSQQKKTAPRYLKRTFALLEVTAVPSKSKEIPSNASDKDKTMEKKAPDVVKKRT